MRAGECRRWCHFLSNQRHKRAPDSHIGPNTPAAHGPGYFFCEGNHHREISRVMLISCETCMQREVMKRCICAVAFLEPSADLQYKVNSGPWCQSFDRDGWSHWGFNKMRADISITEPESRQAKSQTNTVKKRRGSRFYCFPPVLCSVNSQTSYSWGQYTLILLFSFH